MIAKEITNRDTGKLSPDAYQAERRILVEAEFDQGRSFDKTIITLSSAALGLSLAFIDKIASASPRVSPRPDMRRFLVLRTPMKIVPFLLAASIMPAWAQQSGPAPSGNPAVVAQRIIHANFDNKDCPLVTKADRLGDGSIKAVCNNGETFRVFSVQAIGPVAMKCSAAVQRGVSGC